MSYMTAGNPRDVSPCRPPAMFTIITYVIQRSKLVVKPHDKGYHPLATDGDSVPTVTTLPLHVTHLSPSDFKKAVSVT